MTKLPSDDDDETQIGDLAASVRQDPSGSEDAGRMVAEECDDREWLQGLSVSDVDPEIVDHIATLVEKAGDRLRSVEWRLDSLYYITNEAGETIPFRMRREQRQVLRHLLNGNFRLVLLKARQVGMTTFTAILALDTCLFGSNQRCGLIDKAKEDAKKILQDKFLFAYDHLPEIIRQMAPITTRQAYFIRFENGSSMSVGVSLRGGTYQLLHVTEYGKISRRTPDKAMEIKTGALNTVHQGSIAIVESTGEGRGGLFYDMWQNCQRTARSTAERTTMDWNGLFFAWFNEPKYRTRHPAPITPFLRRYFDDIEQELKIEIHDHAKFWYARKFAEMGEKMRQEFPSTPAEAFSGGAEGTYLEATLAQMEIDGQIGDIAYDPDVPLVGLWTLESDLSVVWMMQVRGIERRYIGYAEARTDDFGVLLPMVDRATQEMGLSWHAHLMPHYGDESQIDYSMAFMARNLAGSYPRLDLMRARPIQVRSAQHDFRMQLARQQLMIGGSFDRENTVIGRERLMAYSQKWTSDGWSGTPRRDVAARAASALLLGAMLPEDLFEVEEPF